MRELRRAPMNASASRHPAPGGGATIRTFGRRAGANPFVSSKGRLPTPFGNSAPSGREVPRRASRSSNPCRMRELRRAPLNASASRHPAPGGGTTIRTFGRRAGANPSVSCWVMPHPSGGFGLFYQALPLPAYLPHPNRRPDPPGRRAFRSAARPRTSPRTRRCCGRRQRKGPCPSGRIPPLSFRIFRTVFFHDRPHRMGIPIPVPFPGGVPHPSQRADHDGPWFLGNPHLENRKRIFFLLSSQEFDRFLETEKPLVAIGRRLDRQDVPVSEALSSFDGQPGVGPIDRKSV